MCTYKRPQMLSNLLKELQSQITDNQFTYSAVVVDNDANQSAKDTVNDWSNRSSIVIDYHCEEIQNISMARNRAVENAQGDFVAFIDDDEFPGDSWLLNLYKTYHAYRCDGVLGPVKPYFDGTPPVWLVRGGFCDRKSHKTGTVLKWEQTRTGNALISMDVFRREGIRFEPSLGRTGGEDQRFFRSAIDRGRTFVWCDEADVFEIVPRSRWSKTFYVKKYIQMGGRTGEIARNTPLRLKCRWFAKAIIATGCYALALPFSIVGGMHTLMKCFTKSLYWTNWFIGFFWKPIIKFRY